MHSFGRAFKCPLPGLHVPGKREKCWGGTAKRSERGLGRDEYDAAAAQQVRDVSLRVCTRARNNIVVQSVPLKSEG